jgi:predicted ATPase
MIESLELERFKNFRKATLNLGPLTVIVGTNASGKSNLRDSFRFLHGMSRGYSLADIFGDKYVDGTIQWKGIRGGTQEIAISGESLFTLKTKLSIPNDTNRPAFYSRIKRRCSHCISVTLENSSLGPHITEEKFYSDYHMIFDSRPSDDPPAQEDPRDIFIRLPRDKQNRKHGKRLRFHSSKPVISQLVDDKKVNYWSRSVTSEFLEQLQSMRFLDLSPDAMRLPSFPGQTILGDRGENLSSVLQAICSDADMKNALSEWIRELTPLDVKDFEFIPDQTGRILLSLIEANGRKTSAYSASDGTLRFLAIIAALMGPDAARFYFLEEIDNGIHPTRLGLLLQLIEQTTGKGKVQIVATTHSPQLLAMLSEKARGDAILVYRHEHEAEARLQKIMEIPSVHEVIQKQNLSRLHESGWLENVMAFNQPEEAKG